MSKYSTDSDSSEDRRRKKKHRRRSKSSSVSSDDSRYSSRKKYSTNKRSRERRSRSREKYKSRRDRSRDRGSRSGHSSRSSSSVKKRVSSRDKSPISRTKRRSRSFSKERSKRRSRSSSSSHSHSPRSLDSSTAQARASKRELSSEEQLKTKLEQAVKAAQLANNLLHQQGLISGAVAQKTSIIKAPSASVLDEINKPGFAPKMFIPQSSYSYPSQSFPTDHLSKILSSTPEIPAPPVEVKEGPASIFHPSLMVDPEQKLAKWTKKLFQIRQKALHGDPLT